MLQEVSEITSWGWKQKHSLNPPSLYVTHGKILPSVMDSLWGDMGHLTTPVVPPDAVHHEAFLLCGDLRGLTTRVLSCRICDHWFRADNRDE